MSITIGLDTPPCYVKRFCTNTKLHGKTLPKVADIKLNKNLKMSIKSKNDSYSI